ncbi:MAG: methylmalonyl-CoA epimerase [Gemmatimonadota bacterium]
MSRIDHIGIAVRSLADAVPLYARLLGQNPRGVETVPAERVRVAFFDMGDSAVELLEATDPESEIARFVEGRGPGIHHVCLAVPDVRAALERAEAEGARPVPPGVRTGAGGREVAFLHPASTGGVLIELVEQTASES